MHGALFMFGRRNKKATQCVALGEAVKLIKTTKMAA
jgi:hypothetical protein